MTLRYLKPATPEVEQAMLMIARHVPIGTDIGRPLQGFQRDDGEMAIISNLDNPPTMWYPEYHRVSRLVELNGGRTVELTEYADGDELSRKVMSVA